MVVLVLALALHEDAKLFGLQVSWIKNKVQVFGALFGKAVQPVHVCGKDTEFLDNITYLGRAVHSDSWLSHKVLRQIGLVTGVMNSLNASISPC